MPIEATTAIVLPMSVGDKIREFRALAGMSQNELAKKSGLSQPVIAELESGSQATTKKLPRIAATLGVKVSDLDPAYAEGYYRPPPTFLGEPDLPVFAATEGGRGEMVISSDPIEMVPRPWYLKSVKEGYAVLVTGESMEPRYAPGEIVVVNPKAALIRGKDVIVHTAREGGDFRAMVKAYMGATPELWKLRQFNPPPGEERDFAAPKKEWPFALRVVGRYDGG